MTKRDAAVDTLLYAQIANNAKYVMIKIRRQNPSANVAIASATKSNGKYVLSSRTELSFSNNESVVGLYPTDTPIKVRYMVQIGATTRIYDLILYKGELSSDTGLTVESYYLTTASTGSATNVNMRLVASTSKDIDRTYIVPDTATGMQHRYRAVDADETVYMSFAANATLQNFGTERPILWADTDLAGSDNFPSESEGIIRFRIVSPNRKSQRVIKIQLIKESSYRRLEQNPMTIDESYFNFGNVGSDKIIGPQLNFAGYNFTLFEIPFDITGGVGKVKATYDTAEQKYKITLGIEDPPVGTPNNNDSYWQHQYGEVKQLVNFFGKTTDSEFYNKFRALKKEIRNAGGKLDFDFKSSVLGYLEFSNKSGKPVFTEGGLVFVLSTKFGLEYPLIPTPYIYVKFGIETSLNGQLKLVPKEQGLIQSGFDVSGNLTFTLEPYMGLGANIGIAKGEVGLKVALISSLKFPSASLADSFSSKIRGSVYIKWEAFFFLNGSNTWDLGTATLYPRTQRSLMPLTVPLDAEDFTMKPRSVAVQANQRNRAASTGVIRSNVYDDCSPQLVRLADGRELLVWVEDSPTRNAANRTMLVYSIYANGVWSTPQPVNDDGTVDFAPNLVADENRAYLVWQNGNRVFDDNVTLTELASGIDLAYAEFDGAEFSNFADITSSNSTLEMPPQIAVGGGNIAVVWQENAENDLFGLSGENSIQRRVKLGSDWNIIETIADGLGTVTSIATAYGDSQNFVAFTAKTNGDISEYSDSELFLIKDDSLSRLTSDDAPDYSASFSKDENGLTLLWCSDSGVNAINVDSVSTTTAILDNAPLTNVSAISNNRGDSALVWLQSSGYTSDFYCSYYDKQSGYWSNGAKITSLDKKIRDWSAYIDDEGQLQLAFEAANIIDDTGESEPYGTTDLYRVSIPQRYNLGVSPYVSVEGEVLPSATLLFGVDMTNKGTLPINSLAVKIYSGNNLVSTYPIAKRVEIGDTETIEFNLQLPASLSKRTLTIEVVPADGEDSDMSDNSVTYTYGYADIAIAGINAACSENGVDVRVLVENKGYESIPAANVDMHSVGLYGEVIDSISIASIAPQETREVTFSVSNDYLDSSDGNVLVNARAECEEANYANNAEPFYIGAFINANTPSYGTNFSDEEIAYALNDVPEALSVSASTDDGGNLSYQWYENSVNSFDGAIEIADEYSAEFVPSTAYEGVNYYYAVITNTISDNGDGGRKQAKGYTPIVKVQVSPAPTYSAVEIYPASVEIQKGGTQQFSFIVKGSYNPVQAVIWGVEGTNDAQTTISESGLLTVGDSETAETVTVKATSTENGLIVGFANVSTTDSVPEAVYAIQLDRQGDYYFPTLSDGYTEGYLRSLEVQVFNIGNQPTGDLRVELSGQDAELFTVSADTLSDILKNGFDSFSVFPAPGCTPGTYSATVTVSGSADISPISLAVHFTVEASANTDFVAAKQNIESAFPAYTPQEAAGTEVAALAKIGDIISGLQTSGVTANIVKEDYSAATAGIYGNPSGTDGSYVFLVDLKKGNLKQTTSQLTLNITASAYNSVFDDSAAVASAKSSIEGAFPVTVPQSTAETEAGALSRINNIIGALPLNGVTANVGKISYNAATAGTASNPSGTSGRYLFTVGVSKGQGTALTTAQLSLNISPTPYNSTANDNLDISAAKSAVENAFPLNVAQETAGTADSVGGTNGSYIFTVSVSKGRGTTQTTSQLTLNITASPYATTPLYTLTVNNGIGGGNYEKGTVINITANTPLEGEVFDKWIGDTTYLSNPSTSNASVTMPEISITVAATYKSSLPQLTNYGVTLNGGGTGASGAGSYTSGMTVAISAGNLSGYTFNKWTTNSGVTFANANSANTTFVMPANNVEVTANWTLNNDTQSPPTETPSYTNPPITNNHNDTQTTQPMQSTSPLPATTNAPTSSPSPSAEPNTKTLQNGSKITTPDGEPPVDNGNGTYTLPDGGVIETANGLTIVVPGGTIVSKDGKTVELPCGFIGGTITDKSGSTTILEPGYTATINAKGDIAQISIALPFDNVRKSDWFYNDIVYAYSRGLFNDDGTFDPNAQMTRETLVTLLYQFMGSPTAKGAGAFSDVSMNDAFYLAVEWAKENGLVSGYGDGTFGPGDSITREQLVVILMRLADILGIQLPITREYSAFNDEADTANYAKQAIEAFFRAGIINGRPDGTFDPKGRATYAEVAATLRRFLGFLE